MEKVFEWIQDNWASIVAAFDKLYAVIKDILSK
jgi:hypothetical protein